MVPAVASQCRLSHCTIRAIQSLGRGPLVVDRRTRSGLNVEWNAGIEGHANGITVPPGCLSRLFVAVAFFGARVGSEWHVNELTLRVLWIGVGSVRQT